MYRNFRKDDEYGKRAEGDFLSLLRSRDKFNANKYLPVDEYDKTKRKFYDIINVDTQTKWEVKTDGKSQLTKNAFFEIYNGYGHKTGLLRTWADYYVYRFDWENGDFYVADTKKLTLWLFRYPCIVSERCGETCNYAGIIVPMDTFIKQPFVVKYRSYL